jgi:hypothetical protein
LRSARNRELVALIPVALLLTAGFSAVFAQESARLDNLSLIYGAYFLAVCVVTHIYLRIRLPNADPYLFPLVALLTAFGLVMVYRIDSSLARDQANWFSSCATTRCSSATATRSPLPGCCCCWRPACPESASR